MSNEPSNESATDLWQGPSGLIFVSDELIAAIKDFPIQRNVDHCGEAFAVASLDNYATCPKCATVIKMRSFSNNPELDDVFDAVLEWLHNPAAQEIFEKRRMLVFADLDGA